MCIAIPAQVVEIHGASAVVERYGERLEVSLLLLQDEVAVGDFLILQARAFAVEKIAPEKRPRFTACSMNSSVQPATRRHDGEVGRHVARSSHRPATRLSVLT
ncbi:MAG: HypC/HybG/HupF family hydrogenase formation chaperone [Candidatus Competibacteraceae bacterium]